MIDDAELDPVRRKPTQKDLAPMGIAELEDYIAGLEDEIARARVVIAQKSAHRAGIEGIFKR